MKDGRKRALFLDRDGVINVERRYVHLREEFEFQDGIFDLCQAAQARGYLLIVITNQAGIARGYYSESDYLELTRWMVDRFAERRIEIAQVYYCPFHPIHGVGKYKRESPDRKPNPGMLLRARADYNLDLESSVLIGDQPSDIEAGKAAGVKTTILLARTTAETDSIEDCALAESLDDIRARFFSNQN